MRTLCLVETPFWLDPAAPRRDRRAAGKARRRSLPHEEILAWPSERSDDPFVSAPTTGLQGQLVGYSADLIALVDERSGVPVVDLEHLDDCIEGPWEWDVRGHASRLCITAPRKARGQIVSAFGRAYREGVRAAADVARPGGWVSIDEGPGGSRGWTQLMRGKDRRKRVRQWIHTSRRGETAWSWVASPGRIDRERLPWDAISASSDRVMRQFAEYRESLPEATAFRLQRYSIIDAVTLAYDDSTLVLLFGADHEDRLLLRGRPVGPSMWEPYADISPLGSDAQRILMASALVQVSPDPLLGWSSDPQTLGSVIWSQALDPGPMSPPEPRWLLKREAESYGGLLARAHAATFDMPALAGYLGGSTSFELALATSVS